MKNLFAFCTILLIFMISLFKTLFISLVSNQIPLKFCCKSKVDDQKEFRVLRNAQIPESNDQLPEETFSYSAFIEYNGQKEDNSVIFINGRGNLFKKQKNF